MTQRVERKGRVRARLVVDSSGKASIDTGVSVLDHLLALVAQYGAFDLTLELAPGSGQEQVSEAGRALGELLDDPLHAEGARGHGMSALPVEEALASVALDVADDPLLYSNVDLSDVNVAGLESDLVAGFLQGVVAGAGLNLHVRLVEGEDEQHVLEAIFKALGAALGEACESRPKVKRRTGRAK